MFSVFYVFCPLIITPLEYYDLSYQQISYQEIYYYESESRPAKRIKVNNLNQAKKNTSRAKSIKVNVKEKSLLPSTKELC